MPKINSLEVVHQDTNKDSYQTLHDILVDLKKSLALNQEIVDGEARVAIENLLEMYVNDKEAFLRSLQTLTASFKNSDAILEEEILLKASELEALARRVSTLSAQTETQYASVKEYSEAVASEVARKTTTYSQDDAPTGTDLVYGDIWIDTNDNNRMYSWDGLVWNEVTRVPTYRQTTAPTTAAVGELWMDTDDNNKMYRWNGTSWIATDDLRIAKTFSRWGVNVNANGHVAGIQLNADDTGTSQFTVLADNFRVFKSGNLSNPMFDVGTVAGVTTVGIRGNLVVDGTITTGGLANNAVSVPASYWSTTGITGNGSYQGVASATVTNSASSPMYVIGSFSGFIAVTSPGNSYGFLVQGYGGNNIYLNMGSVDAVGSYPSITFADTIPANTTVSYAIFWIAPSAVQIGARSLTILGTKK